MTRGYGIVDPRHPARFLMSPGLIPENVSRTRTAPGPGSTSGSSPTWRTSAAGPCRSYQAALRLGALHLEGERRSPSALLVEADDVEAGAAAPHVPVAPDEEPGPRRGE